MAKIPSRSRFALQLRTRLVLVLAAGILVFVNARVRPSAGLESEPLIQPEAGMVVHHWERARVRGWPEDFYKSFPSGFSAWSASGVAIDVAVAMLIVGVAVGTCEWVLRKRK